ncbi:GNAT family N-acetyltransferase [Paenibacillus paeoniae]|uniref:N-acetyltransferase n=1 Tax=Paenibacillus paeoniae TaxID=2292705 RepID=A0A371PGH1_9BACL|nr:GNAT family protein [Paenibacillus paeoniae]REK74648.1 N-acetyltransferase [Paenibacillus paeoniae]
MNCWTGTSVRLRAIVAEDWHQFHKNDQDTDSARTSDAIYFPRSEAGTRQWTEETAAKGATGDSMMLAIEKLDGELVGCINAHSCDSRNGIFKYGVAIFRDHWRMGYASDAINLLLRYFFKELRYEKAVAIVYGFNESSIRLQERLGFTLEGRLRSMIFTLGKRHDELVFGLLKSEFEAERMSTS